MQKSHSWFLDHAMSAVLNRRPRHAERVARYVESRYCDIRQADLFADVGGGGAESAAVAAAPASESSSDGDGDDGGDADPESDHPSLSPAEHARQSAAFRTTLTGIPGVARDQKGGSFRASCVAADGKPTRIGFFATIDEAVTAIKLAYAGGAV